MESEIQKEEIKEKKVGGKKKKSNQKKIILVVLAILIVIVILVGVYFSYYGNPKRIIGNAVDRLSTQIKSSLSFSKKIDLGDSYTLSGDVKMNIESDYLRLLSTYNDSYQPYIRLLQNLSKTENHFDLMQNKEREQLFLQYQSTFNQEELIQAKYYIEKDQSYYYIKGFLDTYIHGDKNDYFESLSEGATKDQMLYIYDVCMKSLKNNLQDRYFTKTNDTILINHKEEKVKKVTFTMDNQVMVELAEHILKDLKNDSKANQILTGIDPDFKNSKVEKSEKYLKDGEKLVFHVYVQPFTFEAKKYEVVYQSTDEVYSISYVVDGDLQIQKDGEVFSTIQIEESKNKLTATVLDASNQKIGTIVVVRNDLDYSLDATFTISDITMKFDLTYDCDEIEKNQSYQMKATSNVKVEYNEATLATVGMTLQANLYNTATIEEDISNAVDQDRLEEKSELLQQKLTEVFVKLMS